MTTYSKPTNVMVVEDSPTFRLILANILKRQHITVHEAQNGKEALETLQTIDKPVDLIFLDWYMPELGGDQVLRKLREKPEYQRTKIVVVTSQNSIVSVCDVLAAGADDVITKPFTDDTIENVLWMERAE